LKKIQKKFKKRAKKLLIARKIQVSLHKTTDLSFSGTGK